LASPEATGREIPPTGRSTGRRALVVVVVVAAAAAAAAAAAVGAAPWRLGSSADALLPPLATPLPEPAGLSLLLFLPPDPFLLEPLPTVRLASFLGLDTSYSPPAREGFADLIVISRRSAS